jgi:hypothetical protein
MKFSGYIESIFDALSHLKNIIEYERELYIFNYTKLRRHDIVKIVDKTSKESIEKSLDNSKNFKIVRILLNENHDILFKLDGVKELYKEDNLIRIEKGIISGDSIYRGSNMYEYEKVTKEDLHNLYHGLIDSLIKDFEELNNKFKENALFNIGDKVKLIGYDRVGYIHEVNFDSVGTFWYIVDSESIKGAYCPISHPEAVGHCRIYENQIEKVIEPINSQKQ